MATLRKLDSNKKSTLNRIRYLCCSGHSAITLAPLFFKYLNQLIPHDLHALHLHQHQLCLICIITLD
ncbi:hypothetical protein D9K79_04460 [Acinetobacter cumulans]|uniref:Uncharacterized protein n=1 Tax=Acinetobacter cumulans TaxID=2136182 RepID=A0ABX9U868_9GAMM|nr:hypothetical protein D9K79_04460 [Acinetobacter cumulans]